MLVPVFARTAIGVFFVSNVLLFALNRKFLHLCEAKKPCNTKQSEKATISR